MRPADPASHSPPSPLPLSRAPQLSLSLRLRGVRGLPERIAAERVGRVPCVRRAPAAAAAAAVAAAAVRVREIRARPPGRRGSLVCRDGASKAAEGFGVQNVGGARCYGEAMLFRLSC